jgi:Cof subfamily protein (haloacid dehalogenase superfamily)
MLVVDLDGTALNSERQVSDIDVEAAKKLASHGIPVTIATGRLYTGTDWVAKALGVRGTVAVMNGSELVDVDSGLATHGAYFASGIRAQSRDVLARHGLPTYLFESRRIHFGRNHEAYKSYLSIWTKHLTLHPDVFADSLWEQSSELLAIGVLGPTVQVKAAQEEIMATIPGLDAFAFSTPDGETFLKLRHGTDDKGTALGRLAADRGLTVDEVVAVGDWINDVPMLKVAGRSFVMAHAHPEVRAAAHDVLEASRQGGAIAEIAHRVWGIV